MLAWLGLLWISQPSIAQNFETPWGIITVQQAEMLCAADNVFIGRITNTSPFIPADGFFPNQINSMVRFAVERNIRSSGSNFLIQLPGGMLNDVRHLVEGYPIPIPGRRYFMVVDRWSKDMGPAKEGDLRYFFSVALDAEAPLPNLEDLKEAHMTVCQNLSGQ